jgi:hypothetical protein
VFEIDINNASFEYISKPIQHTFSRQSWMDKQMNFFSFQIAELIHCKTLEKFHATYKASRSHHISLISLETLWIDRLFSIKTVD